MIKTQPSSNKKIKYLEIIFKEKSKKFQTDINLHHCKEIDKFFCLLIGNFLVRTFEISYSAQLGIMVNLIVV